MNISMTSWHYRLLDALSFLPSVTSLCPYVRNLFFALLGIAFAIQLLPDYIYGWVLIFMHPHDGPINAFQWFVIVQWPLTNFAIAFALVIGIFFGVGFLIALASQADAKYGVYGKPNAPPNVFVEYLKALHDKACPMLTFTTSTSSDKPVNS